MRNSKKSLILISAVLVCCLLCGCAKSVKLSAGKLSAEETDISIVLQEGETSMLEEFTQLQSADFSGSACIDEIRAWAQAHPEVNVTYTIAFPNGQTVDNHSESLDLSGISAADCSKAAELMSHLHLKSVNLGENGFTPAELDIISAAAPDAKLSYSFSLDSTGFSLDDTALNLCGMSGNAVQQLTAFLPYMTKVESIELGSESDGLLTWDHVSAIKSACPSAELSYAFNLYGKDFTLADTEMNLYKIPISDEGALVKQISVCMPNLKYIDMDGCGVSSEAMAEIRDANPNANVVWRVWFGERYSVRTDVIKILASNPGLGGELTPENTVELKYCTKVKYLDLGHNSFMSDISFVSYMPDLEVIIAAMADWSDASPLADCPKLEYAEIQTTGLNDLSPLAGLKNLRHLNIGYCFVLHDLSPIYDLELERLWIGKYTPIPPEQIEEYKRRHPDCEVDTETFIDPTSEGWRYLGWTDTGVTIYAPRYELLREQFDYENAPYCYAYYWNDPLCT